MPYLDLPPFINFSNFEAASALRVSASCIRTVWYHDALTLPKSSKMSRRCIPDVCVSPLNTFELLLDRSAYSDPPPPVYYPVSKVNESRIWTN